MRLFPVYHQYRFQFIRGIWLHIILASAGLLTMFCQDIRKQGTWFGRKNYDFIVVKTNSEPKAGKNSRSFTADAVVIKADNKWTRVKGKIWINIPAGTESINPGTLIGFSKHPVPIIQKANTSGFDFKAFMEVQHIYHQARLTETDIIIIYAAKEPAGFIHSIRQNILALLDKYYPKAEERALAKALFVGYRAELEKDLISAYTNTGVIHVIAISGLHLGLIYAILIMLLKPLIKGKKPRIIVNIVILAMLWVFTLICGASPSVTRSAVMFSSLLVGDSISAQKNTGNALASSAFLLLSFDPMLLWDIGFQLSYAAVGSLLIYNNDISKIYSPTNGILLNTWQSISTSISAQILTTPLVLVHFHQFPLLFILSNFIAVPVSGFILILLILLSLCQLLPLIPTVLASLGSYLIRFMNNQVERLAAVRFSVVGDINWNWIDCCYAYFSILTLTIFLKSGKSTGLILFLLTILTWLVTSKYSSF